MAKHHRPKISPTSLHTEKRESANAIHGDHHSFLSNKDMSPNSIHTPHASFLSKGNGGGGSQKKRNHNQSEDLSSIPSLSHLLSNIAENIGEKSGGLPGGSSLPKMSNQSPSADKGGDMKKLMQQFQGKGKGR